MLILEYISTHGTRGVNVSHIVQGPPTGNPVHHAQACVGSTRGERDPLQLVEHSGDAAGVVPAIADILGRATLHHL